MQPTEQEPRSRKDEAHRAGSEAAMRTAASIGRGRFAVFAVALTLSLAVLAASTARGAGPVVGWGLGALPPMITATAIAAGYQHSCAIQAGTGAVVCWGDDYYGQATPPPSVDGTAGTASAIAAGGGEFCLFSCADIGHSCAIQAGTGAVVCWGVFSAQEPPPPSVNGTAGTASAIAAGLLDSCAIQAGTGAVVCWGPSGSLPPPSVDGTAGTASAIAAGLLHSCAIQAGTGAVVCWGGPNVATPPPPAAGTAGTASATAAGAVYSSPIQAGSGAGVWRHVQHDET